MTCMRFEVLTVLRINLKACQLYVVFIGRQVPVSWRKMLFPSLGYSFLDAEVTLTPYKQDAVGCSKSWILFSFHDSLLCLLVTKLTAVTVKTLSV
jgi:hypothetical protein